MSLLPRDDSLPLADRERIDRLCLQFEDEWLAGGRPVLEPYARQIEMPAQGVLLYELLQMELEYRRGLGEQPQLDDYVPRFPRQAAEIRQAFHVAFQRKVMARFTPGARIGRYEVRRILGAGAFAVVYLAWDVALEREVAIKVPHRFLLSDDRARQRFLEEARTIASLRHPRIVALYDAAKLEDGTVYLVMQHVAGSSLRDVLRAQRLTPGEACAIAAGVADAMAAAHCAGVYHRDLKPGNILLDEQREPHVCDFGLAVQMTNQRERRGERAGTLSYMSPELLRGESHLLDGRADIWALGVILYEMLTGRVPFESPERKELCDEILRRDPRPPRQLDPRITRYQERICLRCLAKQPVHRYATAGDVAHDLRRASGPPRGSGLRPRIAALATTLLVALIGGAIWRWPGSTVSPAPQPLCGVLDLFVWDPEDPLRQGVSVDDARAVPLRRGDRLRLSVRLNQPAYIYLVWLDTRAGVLPVFPWEGGQWERRPPEETARTVLTLPTQQEAGWLMQTHQDGMESVLLLVRRSPLDSPFDLQSLLGPIAHGQLPRRASVAWFQDGLPRGGASSVAGRQDRDPQLGGTVGISDPLLRVQREMADVLRPHFELVLSASLPVADDSPAEKTSSDRPHLYQP